MGFFNISFSSDNTPKCEKRYELSAPRRRSMNDDSRDDFVAIDFETFTRLRTSACALGMVKVIDGEIVQQFYSVINPVRDEFTDSEPNVLIHGIPLDVAEKAPTFAEIFEGVKLFIGGLKIVCHNSCMDISVLRQLMEYYGLSGINLDNFEDTYAMTASSLEECCKTFGIPVGKKHNALCDAEACARIYLEQIGKPLIDRGGASVIFGKDAKREVRKEHKIRLDDESIENKNTIFYDARVVITGTFEAFPERDNLAHKLQLLGAKINSSISSKTTIVVMGQGAGPKKVEQINKLKEDGSNITVLREHELLPLL